MNSLFYAGDKPLVKCREGFAPEKGTVPSVLAYRAFDFGVGGFTQQADRPLHIGAHVHECAIGLASVFIRTGIEIVPLCMDVCVT